MHKSTPRETDDAIDYLFRLKSHVGNRLVYVRDSSFVMFIIMLFFYSSFQREPGYSVQLLFY